MPKLFACIISAAAEQAELLSVAKQFAYRIEFIEEGVLMDVSGLEKLVGTGEEIKEAIINELQKHRITGQVAVDPHLNTALLMARHDQPNKDPQATGDFGKLPLKSLSIDKDTLGVFNSLGINRIEELSQIPADQLIARYGQGFRAVIDAVHQLDKRSLIPNLKENKVEWGHDLDDPVTNFEQLIFLLNHGLDQLFQTTLSYGFSSEQIDIFLRLGNDSEKLYEIKTSFPTLEKTFWLKLINLRISFDSPEADINSIKVTCHFTVPRPAQGGLYAASRPRPESLLLTVNKIRKLIGPENVGVPELVNQRLAEPFKLADKLPEGKESPGSETVPPIIVFSYFSPPHPAEVLVRKNRLVYLTTRRFRGRVEQYSGVWKANSRWWEKIWRTNEWDVEMENGGVYRLCKRNQEWFVVGEYD